MIALAGWLRTELPAGLELPDGRLLTFGPHRNCPCRDCVDAWAAFRRGDLEVQLDDRFSLLTRDDLPW